MADQIHDTAAGFSSYENTTRQQSTGSYGIRNTVHSFTEGAKAQAQKAAGPMKEKAREIAATEKDAMADRIDGFAKAIHEAAGDFSRESPAAGEMLRAAAGQIKKASGSLRDTDIDQIARRVDRFARNRPATLFAGAVLAGFAASRFLKSSTPHSDAPVRSYEPVRPYEPAGSYEGVTPATYQGVGAAPREQGV